MSVFYSSYCNYLKYVMKMNALPVIRQLDFVSVGTAEWCCLDTTVNAHTQGEIKCVLGKLKKSIGEM